MTDAALRALEREARQGDPAVQARLLHERLRAGDLSGDDLALAARLGHPAARQAILPAVAMPLVDASRGWHGSRRLIGQLAQRRPLAVAEWLLWIAGDRFKDTRLGPSLLLLGSWIQNPRRLEVLAPDLLLTIAPDRGALLAIRLNEFRVNGSSKLSQAGQELVAVQRLRLAELVLRPREEPLPLRHRSRSSTRTAKRNALYAEKDIVASRPRREPIQETEDETGLLQCSNCNISGWRLGGMHAFMHWHPDPSLVLCDPCHRQRAADARGATS